MTAPMLATALTLSLLSAAPTPPHPRVAERLVGAALTQGMAWKRLEELTDGIGPRLSGSPGAEAAVQWAVSRLREDGVKVWLEPVQVPRWVRGEERAEVLAGPGVRAQALAVTALGGSVGTPEGGVSAEVVEVRSFEELAALGEKARGRLVFFNHDMSRPSDYGRYASLRSRGPAAAGRAGAVGVLVRSLATSSLRSPHTGNTRYDEGGPQVPAASLSVEDAELLHRLLGRGPVRVRLTLGCKSLPDVQSHNVVAEVRGRQRPEEVVLLAAHLDSWDLSPGAHDDGAGVVMVMEAARLLAQLKPAPRRTVRVVLFMNEENGLRGGRAYAQAHAAELPRHVAALEMDSGGGRPLGVSLTAGRGGEALVLPWLAPLSSVGAGKFLSEERAGGADISPLAPAGVPFVGVEVDNSRYFDVHHTAADTLDKVNPYDLARSTAAVTWVAYSLAESPALLPRQVPEPPAPVRATSGH